MRKIILLLMLSLQISIFANNLINTGKYYTYNGHKYEILISEGFSSSILIPIAPSSDCSVIYLSLSSKETDKFINLLTDDGEKMSKWQRTATDNNVKNMEKPLGMCLNGWSWPSWYFSLVNSTAVYSAHNVETWGEHSLWVDGNSICYIKIAVNLGEQILSNGNNEIYQDSNGNSLTITNTQSFHPVACVYLNYTQLCVLTTALIDAKALLSKSKEKINQSKLFD